ncbi:MAG: hypothetical protein KBC17_01015 [Candidatus Pacebacteria bacterium]|nr:hypothetical protein [Candidatus Paceibacterota bacterium]
MNFINSNFFNKNLQAETCKLKPVQGGYSFVETIVYLALFVTVSVVLIGSLFSMMKIYTETRVDNDLLDSAHVSMERMTREIRGATSIDTSASTLGTSPGVLKLNSTTSGGSAKTVQFSLSSGVLKLTDSTDGTARDVTGSKTSVTSLIFRNITTTNGNAVRIEITIQSTRSGSAKTITLYNTVALRGSY